MMRRAICPGSFDPVTHGHLDIIRRGTALVDELVVGVGVNGGKHAMFSAAERVAMLSDAVADLPGVTVAEIDGLLVEFCRCREIGTIIKGVRSGTDLDYEMQMAQMNRQLTGIETVFLPTAAEWAFVSSTLIREISSLGGDISQFVPDVVMRALAQRRATNPTEGAR